MTLKVPNERPRLLVPPVSTFPAINERLEFCEVLPQLLVARLPPLTVLLAVVVDCLHLGMAEHPHKVLGVELHATHRTGPGPRRPFVSQGGHQLTA